MASDRDSDRIHRRSHHLRIPAAACVAAISVLFAVGCRTSDSKLPSATDRLRSDSASRPEVERDKHKLDELEVQARLMSMVDEYLAALGEAVYLHLRHDRATPHQRSLATSILRNGTGAAIDIGASANPTTSVLDLLVVATLQRSALERIWIPREWPDGGPDGCALEAVALMREAESLLWDHASVVLDDDQKRVLRGLIESWIEEHPNQAVVELTRFRDFAHTRNVSSLTSREIAATLLREVGEVARAIDDVRLLGERSLWYSSRLLYVLGQQVELTVYRMLEQPEIAALIGSVGAVEGIGRRLAEEFDQWPEKLGLSIEEAAQTFATERQVAIEELAASVRNEREATVNDVFGRLATEREAILAAFDERLAASTELRGDLDKTLSAGNELALNLERTAAAFGRVLAHFEPDPGAANTPPREPLDMKDVREAALAAGDAADRLTATLEQTESVLVRLEDERTPGAIRSVSNEILASATWRLLGIVAFLLVGLAVLRLVPARRK